MIEKIRNTTRFRQDCLQGLKNILSPRTSFLSVSAFCSLPVPQLPLEGPFNGAVFGTGMASTDSDLMTPPHTPGET